MMKKIIRISFFCIVLLGFTLKIQGQNISLLQIDRNEKQVDSVFHSMITAAENLDYTVLTRGVDDKYHAGFITNGTYYTNFDTLVSKLWTRLQGVKKQHITVEMQKITELSEIVLHTASGNLMVDLTSGNSFAAKFMWSFVYEKINNSCKVIYSHPSGNR